MTKELRVLLLEDRPADAELVMRELRKIGIHFAGQTVASEADFLAQIRAAPPDLILADYSLPAYNGPAALTAAQKECPETPFIFVSGSMGEETAIEALHHGATDYVLKQRLTRLGPAVRRALDEVEERTRRRQVEELLRVSERSHREIFNATNDAIFLHDAATGAILDANQTALDMFGYARDELRKLPGDQLSVGGAFSEQEAVRRIQRAAVEGPQVFEWQSKKKNGELFWTEVALRCATIGGEGRVLAVVRDITQRKNAESALAESRRLRKAILDHIPDPAWLKDLQGRFLACNEPLAQLYGRKIEEVLGKTVFDTIPLEAERMTREDQEVIATGKPIRTEQPATDAPGQRHWFDTIKSPIFNERGDVIGIVGIARDTTERRQTDESLQVSEDRFRSVWEHSIDGMRLIDREGRILAVNEAFCRLVKLPCEKLIGELFSVAYLEQGPEEEIETYRRRFDAGTIPPRLTARKRLWNSEEVDVEISSSFVESGRQNKTLLSIFRDIAERKRAEARVAALSRLGQQLGAAKSAREAAEIIVEVADRLLGWDACTVDLYEAEHDRLVHVLNQDTIDGRRVDFPSAYQNEPPSPLVRRTFESGGQLILKEDPQAMQPDGVSFGNTERPSACIMLVPVREGSRVIGLFSIHSYTPRAYDQSSLEALHALADHCAGALDRISAQEALNASETNYRSLVERSPDAIFLHRDGTFVYANPAGMRLLGVETPQQLLGRSVFDIVPPEIRDIIRQRIKQAAEGGMTSPLEQEILRLDGTSLDAEATSIPFTYEGKPAVQTVMRDITERKQLEQQLRQSQKMDAIGQLAGGVAHDFNNMLAVIRGNAELLLMVPDQHTRETRECLRQVTAASDRAANLTRQLLAFSRKQVMQSRPLVLNDVIADLTKMLKRIIGEHIDLQCRYAAQLPFVQADAGMIEQVVLNLAVNASDAMPRGGQLLIITETASFDLDYARSHPEASAGEFVCLKVSDTGTGIAPEHLPRIFEPFFTTKELGKGTGLGLATVYGIVTQHRGWIEVASQPGAGATFRIFLPAIPTPASAAATPQAEAELPGGTETILLVEDEYAVRMITRRVLERRGYKIYEATTAREALDVWRSHAHEIALLLTDIVMPQGVTGRDLAEQLRAERPALKILFMSGYSADVIGKDTDFFRRTKSFFLQKPCLSRALLETVRRCLDA